MTNEHESQHNPPHGTPDAQTIRLAADGELSADEMARIEALAHEDERIADRLAHERSLREAVGRALSGGVETPAELRERVTHAMSSVPDSEIASVPGDTGTQEKDVVRPREGDTRRRDFWTRMPAVLAMAATITLVASVLIVSFSMSRPLYEDPQFGARVVSFLEREHDSCAAFTEHFDRKLVARSLEDARRISDEWIGESVYALSLDPRTWDEHGFEFMGFGPCGVPGAERSAHMLLRSTEAPSQVASLFVHKDDGRLDFASSNCCYVNDGGQGTDETVVVWSRDGLVYYLYAPNGDALTGARDLFSTPENERDLY